MLCLDDCCSTTIMQQLTEITQFIFGQPLSEIAPRERFADPDPEGILKSGEKLRSHPCGHGSPSSAVAQRPVSPVWEVPARRQLASAPVAALSMSLCRLPAGERLVRLRQGRVHHLLMHAGVGGQLDDVAVRVAEID